MSVQGDINKLINLTAGATIGVKKASDEKKKEIAKQEQAKSAQAEEEAKQSALKEQQAKQAEASKAQSLYKATKLEEQETAQAIKGYANLQAKYRKDFIHSQFDYESLKSGAKSPLEFETDYMNNLANMRLQGIPSFRSMVTSKGWETRRKNMKEVKNRYV